MVEFHLERWWMRWSASGRGGRGGHGRGRGGGLGRGRVGSGWTLQDGRGGG